LDLMLLSACRDWIVSIREEEANPIPRPEFSGNRINLAFYDLMDGANIATASHIERVYRFSECWAKAAHSDPATANLVVHCFAGISRSSANVGEIGLDGDPQFRRHGDVQVAVFEHILIKCRDAGGRIISIHSRRASGRVLDYIEKFPGAGILVLHWFSGSLRDLDRAIKLACWFSVGPAMLASKNGRTLAARMPRDRILMEFDGPFAQLNGLPVKSNLGMFRMRSTHFPPSGLLRPKTQAEAFRELCAALSTSASSHYARRKA